MIIAEYHINTNHLRDYCAKLRVADTVYLSGIVYTARDAAHKRLFAMLKKKQPLPFDIKDAVIYFAGPTPAPDHMPIGSCGPTTSSRMDPYTPTLMDMGLVATIGKGERAQSVYDAIVRNKGVYLCAIGGAGALAAKCVTKAEVIAFEDLGCESVKKLTVCEFPLTVAADATGKNIFDIGQKAYQIL